MVAIGNFDGCHRGHQRVFAALKSRAHAAGVPAIVLTFEPHPRDVFAPAAAWLLRGVEPSRLGPPAGELVALSGERPRIEFGRPVRVPVLHVDRFGNVVLDVDVNKDAVGLQTPAGFAIDTKHVKTSVLIENGGTVVIGGIYTQEQRNDVHKVPLLGDLPAVGPLFRNTQRTDNKTELLVFLTPRIVDDRLNVR